METHSSLRQGFIDRTLLTRMYNPSHPGATLREDVLRRSVFR